MFFRHYFRRSALTLLFALLLLALTACFGAGAEPTAAATRQEASQPLPATPAIAATATSVPPAATEVPTSAPATFAPTETAIPAATELVSAESTVETTTESTVTSTTDMAPGLPDSQVWLVIVQRADGKIDNYRLPAEQVLGYLGGDHPDYAGYQAFIDSIVHLKPGDAIYAANYANTPGLSGPPPASQPSIETPAPKQ